MTTTHRTEVRNNAQAIGELSLELMDALEAGDAESVEEIRWDLQQAQAKQVENVRSAR